MSVEAWTITPPYTISGTGPYQISHPYVEGAIHAYIVLDTGRLELNLAEFAVSPVASDTTGNLTLSPTLAATYAGRQLIIDRITPDEQGWIGVQGEREAGLEAQLDRNTQSIQELRARGAGALRTRTELPPFDWAEGTVPILQDGKPKSGPTADAIAAAQTRAAEAAASAAAAAASAAEALAKQNSMLRDRGAWGAGILYSASDIFTDSGNAYITQTAHIATSIAADLAAGRIRVFAAKGAAGPGTGDMLNADNLAGLTNKPLAYTNIGGKAVGKVDLLPFSLMDPAAVITDTETLAANKVANALPTAKAVTDYVDTRTPNIGPGQAPVFACRAWANISGLGVFFRGQGNCFSVTRPVFGIYQVVMTVPMPDASYAVIVSGNQLDDNSAGDMNDFYTVRIASSQAFEIRCFDASGVLVNPNAIFCAVFR